MLSFLPSVLILLVAPAGRAAPAFWNQVVESPPVSARLQVISGPRDVATPLVVQIEVEIPSLSLDESLAAGEAALFRPEPDFGKWYCISRFPLVDLQQREDADKGLTRFCWTCRWEARLPGSYSLPALRIRYQPTTRNSKPFETTFQEVPVKVASLIPGDIVIAAKPRPAVTKLPTPPPPVPRWLALILVVMAWRAFRWGYAQWVHAAGRTARGTLRNLPGSIAVEQLHTSRSSREAYQILRRFVREICGLDPAKFSPEDLARHPLLNAPAGCGLAPLLEELQAGAFSHGDASLSPALRERLELFLRTFSR